jgi:hypothetical protein
MPRTEAQERKAATRLASARRRLQLATLADLQREFERCGCHKTAEAMGKLIDWVKDRKDAEAMTKACELARRWRKQTALGVSSR